MRAIDLVKTLNDLIQTHGEDIPVYLMAYDGGGENEHDLICEPKFFPKGISNQDYLESIESLPDRLVIEG